MKYDVLVIDDDPLVLSDARIMYENMIDFGDFDFLGDNGTVSIAKNASEAENILEEHFEEDSGLVQILHVDQRMPKETGSSFVDRMRWAYAGRRIGAMLVTGYSADASVQNSRESGVYRFISKPVTAELIKPHLEDLVKVIFSKEKPVKRDRKNKYIFTKIDNYLDYENYLKLRFSVYNFMNYIPSGIKMIKSRYEIDKFDKNAIPFGGFEIVDNQKMIVSSSRLILREKQTPYFLWLENLLDSVPEKELKTFFFEELKINFPSEENYLLNEYYDKGPKIFSQFCEISRMITHLDYRGLDLSRDMIEMAMGYALHKGYRYAVGGNTPQHMPMYNLYGYNPINLKKKYINTKKGQIKDGNLLFFQSVAQVAHIVIADLESLPEPTNTNVLEWKHLFENGINNRIYFPN